MVDIVTSTGQSVGFKANPLAAQKSIAALIQQVTDSRVRSLRLDPSFINATYRAVIHDHGFENDLYAVERSGDRRVAGRVDRSDFDYLSRKLQGYRVRHNEHTWSVDRVTMAPDGRLCMDIGGDASRTLAVDVPDEFDPHNNEHLAWLLGWIEHSLVA